METSQRIVDVLYKCLSQALPDQIPAASQGTMNNLTFGGIDPRTSEPFAYYETVCGGMGARPGLDGISGVHTHMTNSMNTPVEAFEHDYPVRVVRYGLRKGSGGEGRYRGGDGVVEARPQGSAQAFALARGPSGAQAAEARGSGARQQVRAHRLALDGVRRRLQSAARCDADLI